MINIAFRDSTKKYTVKSDAMLHHWSQHELKRFIFDELNVRVVGCVLVEVMNEEEVRAA